MLLQERDGGEREEGGETTSTSSLRARTIHPCRCVWCGDSVQAPSLGSFSQCWLRGGLSGGRCPSFGRRRCSPLGRRVKPWTPPPRNFWSSSSCLAKSPSRIANANCSPPTAACLSAYSLISGRFPPPAFREPCSRSIILELGPAIHVDHDHSSRPSMPIPTTPMPFVIYVEHTLLQYQYPGRGRRQAV